MRSEEILLEIKDLSVEYRTQEGNIRALDKVRLTLHKNEFLGLVGESGSGKSTLAYAIIGLLPINSKIISGEILFDGEDITKLPPKLMRALRGRRISMIFQDPTTSLNPVFKIEDQICRVIELHKGVDRHKAKMIASENLTKVELPDVENIMKSYPFELSGGMQQRVMIAMALSLNPDLIIADEPTSAVDATIQFQILELLKDLKGSLNLSMLFITHNLDIVGNICDRVAVMYAGRIIEEGSSDEVFKNPKHPYTQLLMKAIPRPRRDRYEEKRLYTIEGNIPDMLSPPKGCKFHPRCPYAFDKCKIDDPELKDLGSRGKVACHLY